MEMEKKCIELLILTTTETVIFFLVTHMTEPRSSFFKPASTY